jgi:two-component system chemotaxis sensor kinase CheA
LNTSIEIKSQNVTDEEILITIPISSSIIKAQLIQIGKQIYAIPMDYIEKIMSLNSIEKRISCNKQFIMYMGSSIPVISIYDKLNLKSSNEISGYVVLKYNNKMKALPVNSLLDQSDVVIRPKPLVISEIKEFRGATILWDGNVTMVFDIPYIIENAS